VPNPLQRTFLNIASHVTFTGEAGLLGLAFHPNYATNKQFFVFYSYDNGGGLRSHLSRFVATSLYVGNASSEVNLLNWGKAYTNHNGGCLKFGPDGYLYVAVGDGGSGGDPQNHAQNKGDILGKILRIDVNAANYTIPSDNPFVGVSGALPEIWTYGMRNPWRFSFDRVTGDFWCGDVGQDIWEEVDVILKGRNYGWRITEGNSCYNPTSGCNMTGIELPIFFYKHTGSVEPTGQSVTGGFVYRGSNCPSLYGKYVFADYNNGKVWTLTFDQNNKRNNNWTLLFDSPYQPSAFGVDTDHELYMAAYSSNQIYKFNCSGPVASSNPTTSSSSVIATSSSVVATSSSSPATSASSSSPTDGSASSAGVTGAASSSATVVTGQLAATAGFSSTNGGTNGASTEGVSFAPRVGVAYLLIVSIFFFVF